MLERRESPQRCNLSLTKMHMDDHENVPGFEKLKLNSFFHSNLNKEQQIRIAKRSENTKSLKGGHV